MRERGLLTQPEVAAKLGISVSALKQRRLKGTLGLIAYHLDDNDRHVYEDQDAKSPRKQARRANGGKSVKGGAV